MIKQNLSDQKISKNSIEGWKSFKNVSVWFLKYVADAEALTEAGW